MVKWSRYRSGVAQRVGRVIALLFHDRGTRRGWVVSSTPRPHFTPGKDSVPILQEAGWVPGPVWTGTVNLILTGFWSRTVQPVVSRYTDWATGSTFFNNTLFISVFNQLDAQNLFHNKFYFMPVHVSSICVLHQEVKIALPSLWYHHTYWWTSGAQVGRGLCYISSHTNNSSIIKLHRIFIAVEASWNVMVHAQKPDFVFRAKRTESI